MFFKLFRAQIGINHSTISFNLFVPIKNHLRDYHEELKGALMVMDPAFRIEDLNMWKENFPNSTTMSDGQLCKADDKIDELLLSQNKLSFEADALALARDAAQLATLYREEQKTDRGARLAKVLHLKQQNQISSSLTMDFMRKRCHHVAGPTQDLNNALDKVEGLKITLWFSPPKIIHRLTLGGLAPDHPKPP